MQYAVHEPDAERAEEIAGEFYPTGDSVRSDSEVSPDGPSEEDEQLARICDLARQLGYNEAKTRMKLGQWAGNLAGLEREMVNGLDALPDQPGTNGQVGKPSRVRRETTREAAAVEAANSPSTLVPPEGPPSAKDFLF
jgi:hypothetical protein